MRSEKDIYRKELATFKSSLLSLCEKINKDIIITIDLNHIYERSKERQVDIIDLRNLLYNTIIYHTCELLYYFSLPSDIRPFRIDLVYNEFSLCLARRDDHVWSLKTIILRENNARTFKRKIDINTKPLSTFRSSKVEY